jgi:hypothetical protein
LAHTVSARAAAGLLSPAKVFMVVILRSGADATKNLAFMLAHGKILRFAQNDKYGFE